VRLNIILAILAVSLVINGCSTNSSKDPGHDGTRLFGGGPTSAVDFEKMKSQLEQNARSSAAKSVAEGAIAGQARPGIVAIGKVGSFRKLDPDVRPEFYKKSYARTAEKWHPNSPAVMTEEEFIKGVAGYTAVVTWSIPSVIARSTTAAIRVEDVSRIDFPGPRAANFLGSTGDLVVARSNADGIFFVTDILCKESGADYKSCAAQYVRGSFDQTTGAELEKDMKPKSDGNRIDVTTYKVIPKI
jgi:hypothetical protein